MPILEMSSCLIIFFFIKSMFCVAIRLEVKRIVSTFFLIHAHHESEKKKSPNTGFGGFPSFLTL